MVKKASKKVKESVKVKRDEAGSKDVKKNLHVPDQQAANSSDKKALAKKAVKIILEGISTPAMQNSTKAYIPKDWSETYKPSLGAYKKFVLSRPEVFTVFEHDAFNFTVHPAKDLVGTDGSGGGSNLGGAIKKGKIAYESDWQKELVKAWLAYCKATQRPDRSFDEFRAAIPET
eukprot:TRINITY_DN50981_c0_g1_i1.p1 TRINITY_DN50981_c0_g1~~TRINITY_DN50981_c0_g1_i1.p1  ORF type:complete len:174 (+),score=33.61 TRINITY_DN50981_c0_g1_i1:63-584(+)